MRAAERQRHPLVAGPPGTAALRDGVLAYMAANTAIRGQEGRLIDPAILFEARDVEPGVAFSAQSLTVIAAENSHYALTQFESPQKSYALRFDTPDRSIAFTGDTGESPAVAQLARGADILISEMVTDADVAAVPAPVQAHMRAEHLSPTQVGRLATAAGVGSVVLSHYTGASESDLAAIRREYPGEVTAGQDLMRV